MTIPSVNDLRMPVLRALGSGAKVSTRSLTQSLAIEFGLSEPDLEVRRADGRPLFRNRIEWARTALKKRGLVEYPAPSETRITEAGLRLLESDPRGLSADFFEVTASPPPVQLRLGDDSCLETLEQELRRLSGAGAAAVEDWEVVRRLNGWGPQPPMTYRRLATQLGTDEQAMLRIGRRCRVPVPEAAPMLDAALRLVLSRPDRDPDELALDLVRLGIAADAFSLQGLAEAARRFGRFTEWCEIVRQLSKFQPRTARPRPFESWFEVDVFLYVHDLGHRVIPQKRIGNYRVDLLLPDFVPQLVIECDGDRFHGVERAKQDEAREANLAERGYTVVRFKYSAYKTKPDVIKRGLAEELGARSIGVQTRAG